VNVVVENWGVIVDGFIQTLELFGLSAAISLVLGVLLAIMRVSPLPPLRWLGTAYVALVRNTPLVLVFLFVVFGLPVLGLLPSFFSRAIMALSVYTAAFVCEVVRAGILTVQPGQAEAARALGMTFGQNLRLIIVPQAMRAVVGPTGSVMIALAKNTAIAEAFGISEATGVLDRLVNAHADALLPIFLVVAGGYVVITLTLAGVFRLIERRVATA
jgi:glutamate transport system permease protein